MKVSTVSMGGTLGTGHAGRDRPRVEMRVEIVGPSSAVPGPPGTLIVDENSRGAAVDARGTGR
ncbi:hypothetical protein GCM10023320_82360 [Pseudonocardia adelaidensis]|uniref:Uncharacterized protein n=1 Tax=Pseudonocardia adelaidensis TaxID=648754 RepID=A0ABP9P8A7_9PSEU